LTCIGEHELLHQLFERIFIPKAVYQELTHQNTPDIVRQLMLSPPGWIEIHEVEEPTNTSLDHLDVGEKEAILLAEKMGADILLIDEKKGRLTATERGLTILGVLGLLELAYRQEKVDLQCAIDKLLQTNLKISPSLIQYIKREQQD
jgi:predicted nucleic acid-binding protein